MASPPPTPPPVRDLLVRDGSLALLLFVLYVLSASTLVRLIPEYDGPGLLFQLIAGALMTIPLALRRILPRTVMWVVTVAFSVNQALGGVEATIATLALFLVIYTVGSQLPPERSRWPRVVVVSAMLLLVAYVTFNPLMDAGDTGLELVGFDRVVFATFSIVLNLAFFAAAWIIGDLVWRSRRDERELAERAEELAASRELLAERAVRDERVRIARELHDVVAHHVSVMGIQAGAARRAADRDPRRVGEALASVEQSSRDAIAELQRLLGFLRQDDDTTNGHEPQPTLGNLDDLITSVRDTGLAVDVEVAGAQRPLADTLELSAYRIVQEALTNTLRHAQDVTLAEVRLTYDTDRLRITVRDDGTASSRTLPGAAGGRGLVGMRERAALHAGELTASSQPGGGFVVDGWLPIREARP